LETTTTTQDLALGPLSQSDLTVRDPVEDIRGRTVYDRDGEEIGTVDDLIVDRQEWRVRFIQLASGVFLGIGARRFLIPVDAITDINDEGVHLDQNRERIAGGPVYEPHLVRDTGFYGGVYGYYGYMPYWTPGYGYPPYPYYRPDR
jgi:sporulation protein YlmC with PRC-barrel domain